MFSLEDHRVHHLEDSSGPRIIFFQPEVLHVEPHLFAFLVPHFPWLICLVLYRLVSLYLGLCLLTLPRTRTMFGLILSFAKALFEVVPWNILWLASLLSHALIDILETSLSLVRKCVFVNVPIEDLSQKVPLI